MGLGTAFAAFALTRPEPSLGKRAVALIYASALVGLGAANFAASSTRTRIVTVVLLWTAFTAVWVMR